MKKKTIIYIIAILIGGVALAAMFFNGVFKKNSLEKLLKKKPQYTGLVSAEYSSGGSMRGEHYSTSIGYDKDGGIIYKTSSADFHYVPSLVRIYEVDDKDTIKKLDEYVNEYNLSVWDSLPKSDLQVLDGPSSHLYLRFKKDDNQRFADSMSIGDDLEFPEGGYDIVHNFVKMMGSFDMHLIDIHLTDNGEDIYLGKDIENSDEQVETALTGFFSDDNNVYVDMMGTHINYRGIYGDEISEYESGQIIHESYKDQDCSWYVKYDDENKPLIITCFYEYVLVEDKDGNTYTLKRR